MDKGKHVMVGVRVDASMARALDIARGQRGMRSVSAFCRWSIEKSLAEMGIHCRPATPADAPLFQTVDEMAARDDAPGQPPPPPELGTAESNGKIPKGPETGEEEDVCDLSKVDEMIEQAKRKRAKEVHEKSAKRKVAAMKRKK